MEELYNKVFGRIIGEIKKRDVSVQVHAAELKSVMTEFEDVTRSGFYLREIDTISSELGISFQEAVTTFLLNLSPMMGDMHSAYEIVFGCWKKLGDEIGVEFEWEEKVGISAQINYAKDNMAILDIIRIGQVMNKIEGLEVEKTEILFQFFRELVILNEQLEELMREKNIISRDYFSSLRSIIVPQVVRGEVNLEQLFQARVTQLLLYGFGEKPTLNELYGKSVDYLAKVVFDKFYWGRFLNSLLIEFSRFDDITGISEKDKVLYTLSKQIPQCVLSGYITWNELKDKIVNQLVYSMKSSSKWEVKKIGDIIDKNPSIIFRGITEDSLERAEEDKWAANFLASIIRPLKNKYDEIKELKEVKEEKITAVPVKKKVYGVETDIVAEYRQLLSDYESKLHIIDIHEKDAKQKLISLLENEEKLSGEEKELLSSSVIYAARYAGGVPDFYQKIENEKYLINKLAERIIQLKNWNSRYTFEELRTFIEYEITVLHAFLKIRSYLDTIIAQWGDNDPNLSKIVFVVLPTLLIKWLAVPNVLTVPTFLNRKDLLTNTMRNDTRHALILFTSALLQISLPDAHEKIFSMFPESLVPRKACIIPDSFFPFFEYLLERRSN